MKLLSPLQSFTRILAAMGAIRVTLVIVGMVFNLPILALTLEHETFILKLVNAQGQNLEEPASENIILTPKFITDGISQRLNYAHFVPIGPLADCVGN
jgi:hypothetical protein